MNVKRFGVSLEKDLLKALADKLIAIKGIKHGELVMSAAD